MRADAISLFGVVGQTNPGAESLTSNHTFATCQLKQLFVSLKPPLGDFSKGCFNPGILSSVKWMQTRDRATPPEVCVERTL